MLTFVRHAVAALAITAPLLLPPSAAAQSATPQQLAAAYVAAIQSRDADRLLSLLDPRVLACRNASTASFYGFFTAQVLDNVPHTGYHVYVSPLHNASYYGLPPNMFPMPIQATTQLQIDWSTSDSASTSSIQAIVRDGGGWYIVLPCPTAAGLQFFNDHITAGNQQQSEAGSLAAQINPSFRAHLADLIKQGNKIDAIHQYQAATGADLTTAVQVITALAPTQQ